MVNKKADRARQFLPFDALKGYKEAIKEKQIIKENRKILSEDDYEILSNKLLKINKGIMVKIVHYENYHYQTLEGLVSKIDLDQRFIVIVKKKILIDDIIDIHLENEDDYFIDNY